MLQQTQFQPLRDDRSDYHLYVLLAPHLGNAGWRNTAWVGDYKGMPMLFAQRNGTALAVASTPNWTRASAGFVGISDGWQDRDGEPGDDVDATSARRMATSRSSVKSISRHATAHL